MELLTTAVPGRQLAEELRQRLNEQIDLPILPEVARELLLLRNRPDADLNTLVDIISRDPVISAHMLRYARMSIFGYGDRVKTLGVAINLVLGYEKAIHMAMGLSANRSMTVEKTGPLGLKAFWRNSLNCALLTQALAKELPAEYKVNHGIAYLAGLFHDIGFLVFGTLYPDEFSELNKVVASYEWVDVRELEFHSVGISHDMIGSSLMRIWEMPEEITVAVGEHHFPDYDGKHAMYSKLVYLADQLVHADDQFMALESKLARFEKIGLGQAAIDRAFEQVESALPDLDLMADDLMQA